MSAIMPLSTVSSPDRKSMRDACAILGTGWICAGLERHDVEHPVSEQTDLPRADLHNDDDVQRRASVSP